MSDTKVLHCRLNSVLAEKLNHIKNIMGYDSDAECIRFLINIFALSKKNDFSKSFSYETIESAMNLSHNKSFAFLLREPDLYE